jgi:hypothetical protein
VPILEIKALVFKVLERVPYEPKFLFCVFETGSHYVAQAGLELVIPLLLECWDHRHVLPYLVLHPSF